MQHDQWHYKDERNGKRLGPVDTGTIERLIAEHRIERTTLVWNPAMPEWAKAGSTDLMSLFGATPPPLPASEIRRWPIYALSLFPLWGQFIQAAASAALSQQLIQAPTELFDHRAWIAFFILGNCILASIDEWHLRNSGLHPAGAALMAGIVVPLYILISCAGYQRLAGVKARFTFTPFLLWLLAFVGAIVANPLYFDPGAPTFFRPDTWF